ncbi:glycosyltransferase [Xylophilus ampelinus]|uniref:Glycosyl transferase family 2 n=1 Tax=Xylophilus ampelinus TaxID=54067 RepID=A0A318SUK5_9BURK|nr:glycosyltransferase [Xylophilus ampelinus]MCS4511693.1 glycosyltransferase [Xylophilus ampelinus]PYE73795.1 glycosyl transferase family 2 [Xylophilus ampelinus]
MIGVCVPAHDEALEIEACLASIQEAARHVLGEPVRIVVVADACNDDTAAIARAAGCDVLTLDVRCVGAARAAGADYLLALGVRWMCCTDADTRVPPHWITVQLACGSDAVCGTIGVDDWREYPAHVAEAFYSHYQDRDGHRHVHGANFGVSAASYRLAGGFMSLVAHEDVRLVEMLLSQQASIAWVRDPHVLTSARRLARAPAGFSHWLGMQWEAVPAGTTSAHAAIAG